MSAETRSFAPHYKPSSGSGQGQFLTSVTVASSGTAAASSRFPGNSNGGEYQIQISNKTTSWAHIQMGEFGNVLVATLTNGYPVAPGTVVTVTVPPEVSGASVILDGASGGSTSVVFTVGQGL